MVSGGGSSKSEKAPGTFFLGRYRVVEEIGIGGMASVHLARMDGPGGFQKWVAIKRIHPNLVEDDQFVDMFLDEARIAAGINHANVAQVFDLGKDDGTYWIAMEYLHGEPLREVMRRCEDRTQLISPDLAARICADAAEGLHAAHELRGKNNQLLGLVHRDVTPHNLFITYDGYTKVVDFGIAKVADRLSETRAGTLKGKLAYMSPEQVRGQDDVDRTTDVFALGVVLWELTTGHRLFRMDTDLDTLEKVQACVVPPPSTVIQGYPIELESVVMKALAKKKPERFQTARELSRALQTYLLRRGVFVGPEDVAAFVRELFSDRIKSREAHLAWAADVTSTINIDQLNAMKARPGAEDASTQSAADGTEQPTGRQQHSPNVGRPSVPGQASMGMRPAAGAPPQSPMNGRPGQPGQGQPGQNQMGQGQGGQAQGYPQNYGAPPQGQPGSARPGPRAPTPPAPPTVPSSPLAKGGMGMTSLVDDDEDIPTTVATRDHMQELGVQQAPAPRASGRPQQPRLEPHQLGSSPQRGALPGSLRATTMGLGSTIAIPAAEAQRAGFPTHAPMPSSRPMMGPGNGPPPLGMAHGPLASGPPANKGSSTRPPPPTFGPPPPSSSSGVMHAVHPNAFGQTIAMPPQSHPGLFANPGDPQGYGAPYGAPDSFPGASSNFPGGPYGHGPPHASSSQSTIETALSLPRPDAAAMWMAQQARVSPMRDKNTLVLIAVAVLTAICVLALGALIYFKKWKKPDPPPATSTTSMSTSAGEANGPPADAASQVALVAATTQHVAPSSPGQSATSTETGSAAEPPGPGYLTVICKPFCDNVRCAGTSLGASPVVKSPTPAGRHRVALTKKGSRGKSMNVDIEPGKTYTLRVDMK